MSQKGKRRALAAAGLVVVVALVSWGLSHKSLSDRAQLIELLDQMQKAVETKDTKLGLACISSGYRDSFGLHKAMIRRLAARARFSPETYRLLLSDVNLSIDGTEAQGRMVLEAVVRNGDVIEAQYEGPVLLSFRKERGGWKIASASGWQQWVEGFDQ